LSDHWRKNGTIWNNRELKLAVYDGGKTDTLYLLDMDGSDGITTEDYSSITLVCTCYCEILMCVSDDDGTCFGSSHSKDKTIWNSRELTLASCDRGNIDM